MTMLTDFVADLKTITLVASKVGSRVYPVVGKKTVPSIVYTTRGDQPVTYYQGSKGFNRASISLNIYTTSYSDLDGLRRAIISKYNGFSGVLNTAGVYVSRVEAISVLEDYNSETKTYRQVLDIQITYNEV